jgi:peptide/nickel transport system permease protein
MLEIRSTSTPLAAMAAGSELLSAAASEAADALYEHGLEVKARSQWASARKRFLRHRLAVASLLIVTAIFLCGALANFIAPHSYSAIDLTYLYHAPTAKHSHYFGTDQLGRDYFSRVVYGIRTSEKVGLLVALFSTLIGMLVGAVAGFFGGWIDNILMRVTDLVLTLPALPVLLTAAALFGQGNDLRVTLILAFFFWTPLARIVRASFLSLRENDYVEAAKAAGATDLRIMFRPYAPKLAWADRRQRHAHNRVRNPR